MTSAATGSSPLARGKLTALASAALEHRLIPARAGKTPRHPSARVQGQAHPRSRGENPPRSTARKSRAGSSPLARGKLRPVPGGRAGRGLIPARAGKTAMIDLFFRESWAHPRSRGENLESYNQKTPVVGSSPLARGKLELGPQPDDVPGLIPARAGKTPSSASRRWAVPAHPRSRGENAGAQIKVTAVDGSSPLARGKRRGWSRDWG